MTIESESDPENHHPSVFLQSGGLEDWVDEDLAPILEIAWAAGIETMSGCQNAGESLSDLAVVHPHMKAYLEASKDRAYIDFIGEGIADFLTLVYQGCDDREMEYRIYHWCAPDAWRKTAIVLPFRGNEFTILGHQLIFPTYDIDSIPGCLERGLERGTPKPMRPGGRRLVLQQDLSNPPRTT